MMDAGISQELCIPDNVLQPLLRASNSLTLNDALQILIAVSKTDTGRSELASKQLLIVVLQLVQSVSILCAHHLLLLGLRLLRNLCAGEPVNQNMFIDHNGIEVVSAVFTALGFDHDESGYMIARTALQVLANVSLAGVKHQLNVWRCFFPHVFLKVARLRRRETCDSLSMIVYTCTGGSVELFVDLCGNPGLAIMAEIFRTVSEVGFGEDWIKLLISRLCLEEESHFAELFTMLSPDGAAEHQNDAERSNMNVHFTSEQAFFLRILSEILNERLREISVCTDFALHVLEIIKRATTTVDFYTRGQSGLPTGCASIDVLGYSLSILKDISAQGGSVVSDSEQGSGDTVYSFVSRGLLDLLLSLLCELELPSSIRKTMKLDENQELISQLLKVCPYKGFRRDIVAVIGNCACGRKNVQDEVREKNGLMLLLQQCVLDEDNPFLREWGIWSANNLLEGNAENQQLVANLEMQATVDVPELTDLGLQVEVDPNTKRAKLVNIA